MSGAVGFVGHTVQGAANTPGTIKKAATKKKGQEAEADNTEEQKMDEFGRPLVPEEMEDMDDCDLRTERADTMIPATEIESYNQEKERIHAEMLKLKELSTNDDPAVMNKFNEILALTSKPEHIRTESLMR